MADTRCEVVNPWTYHCQKSDYHHRDNGNQQGVLNKGSFRPRA